MMTYYRPAEALHYDGNENSTEIKRIRPHAFKNAIGHISQSYKKSGSNLLKIDALLHGKLDQNVRFGRTLAG